MIAHAINPYQGKDAGTLTIVDDKKLLEIKRSYCL